MIDNYDINNKKINMFDKLFSICVTLLPFLYQYKGIGNIISLGELLLLPFIIISFFKKKNNKIKLSSEIVLYFVLILLTIINAYFSHFVINDSLTVLARMLFYALVIKIGKESFKLSYVFSFYKKVTLVFAIYLIIQQLYHTLTGGFLPIYISYKFLFPPEQRAEILSIYYRFLLYRPSSLFLEPGYFSLFCIPFLCITPFLKKQNFFDKVCDLIVYVSVILSGSSAGIIAICIIIYSYLNSFFKKSGFKKGLNYILTFVFSIVLLLVIGSNFKENDYIERTVNGASFNYRVVRGIEIYKKLDIPNKIVGVGPNNIENYMKYNNLMTNYDEKRLDYCSSFTQILNYFGIIGLIFFSIYLINVYKDVKTNSIAKLLFVLVIFTLSYEAVFFTYRYAYLILFSYGLKKEKISE